MAINKVLSCSLSISDTLINQSSILLLATSLKWCFPKWLFIPSWRSFWAEPQIKLLVFCYSFEFKSGRQASSRVRVLWLETNLPEVRVEEFLREGSLDNLNRYLLAFLGLVLAFLFWICGSDSSDFWLIYMLLVVLGRPVEGTLFILRISVGRVSSKGLIFLWGTLYDSWVLKSLWDYFLEFKFVCGTEFSKELAHF